MREMIVVAKIKPEKRNEFLDVMRSLQSEKMKVKGIRGSTLYEDKDPSSFRLVDVWVTEEDLERYRQGESFRVFLGALRTLCAEAEVTYGPCPREGGDGNFQEVSIKSDQHCQRKVCI